MNPFESEELEAEYNARFDYVREAYGPSQLNPEYEAYCDTADAESFDEWRADRNPSVARLENDHDLPQPGDDEPMPLDEILDYKPNHDNEIPF